MATTALHIAAGGLLLACTAAGTKRPVLFLVSDDMRPQLNVAYGSKFMHTPNLDRLAASGTVFDRHYTNFAICSASRNSFMTGRMPDTTQVWNFIQHFRVSKYWDNATDVTMPGYFKQAGYLTLGAGKLFHPNKPPKNDEPFSWSPDHAYVPPYVGGGWNTSCAVASGASISSNVAQGWVCVEEYPAPDGTFTDGLQYADYNESVETAKMLRMAAAEYKSSGKPFFIGLGVTKPHASWNVDKYFFDMYSGANAPPLAGNQYSPRNVPDIAFTAELDGQANFSLTGPPGIPDSQGPAIYPLPSPGHNPIPGWFQRDMRAGYWAALSMADHHLGIALDALDETGLQQETLVIFTADHGYQLGEHSEWAKHTNFELATHVPLIIRAPWIPGSAGKHTSSFTELVDLYRTIASLAGLDAPGSRVQGEDQSALLHNPAATVRTASYSQYSRCPGMRNWPTIIPNAPLWMMNNCETVPAPNITAMGYTVRTAVARYTAWFAFDGASCTPKWTAGPVFGRELYIHNETATFPIDWDGKENENVVEDPAYKDLVTEHHALILKRYQLPGPGRGCPGVPTDRDAGPSLEDFF